MRRLVVAVMAGAISLSCVNMPGDPTEPCTKNGLCASGFVCDSDTRRCVKPSGHECQDGATRPCGEDLGACERGVERCTGGTWSGVCGGPDYVGPVDEIPCDGIDNNCNGDDDDTCPDGASCDLAAHLCKQQGAASCGYLAFSADNDETSALCRVGRGDYSIGDPAVATTLPTYFIDRYEVTNQRYASFVDASGAAAHLPHCRAGDRSWTTGTPHYPRDLADHPVVCVTRAQAQAFCRWAGKRLPTATEWEAAARGSDGRTYPWGDSPGIDNMGNGEANCNNSSCHDFYPMDTCTDGQTTCPDTAPVQTLQDYASPLGLMHMVGNAAEWIAAEHDSDPLIVRGGSWDDYADAPDRRLDPRVDQVVVHDDVMTIGFRCAMDALGGG